MKLIILLIIIAAVVYANSRRAKVGADADTGRQKPTSAVPTASAVPTEIKPDPDSLGIEELRKTILYQDIQNLFEDLAHLDRKAKLLSSVRTEEDDAQRIQFLIFIENDPILLLWELNYRIHVADHWDNMGASERGDAMARHKSNSQTLLFVDYQPLSMDLSSPDLDIYEKGSYRRSYFGEYAIEGDNAGGVCLSASFLISSVNLQERGDVTYRTFSETRKVDNRIVSAAIREVAGKYRSVNEAETHKDATLFEIEPAYLVYEGGELSAEEPQIPSAECKKMLSACLQDVSHFVADDFMIAVSLTEEHVLLRALFRDAKDLQSLGIAGPNALNRYFFGVQWYKARSVFFENVEEKLKPYAPDAPDDVRGYTLHGKAPLVEADRGKEQRIVRWLESELRRYPYLHYRIGSNNCFYITKETLI